METWKSRMGELSFAQWVAIIGVLGSVVVGIISVVSPDPSTHLIASQVLDALLKILAIVGGLSGTAALTVAHQERMARQRAEAKAARVRGEL